MGRCAQCGGENEVCCDAALPGSGYSCRSGLACGIRTVIGESESPFCYRCGGNGQICCDVGGACEAGFFCDPTMKSWATTVREPASSRSTLALTGSSLAPHDRVAGQLVAAFVFGDAGVAGHLD